MNKRNLIARVCTALLGGGVFFGTFFLFPEFFVWLLVVICWISLLEWGALALRAKIPFIVRLLYILVGQLSLFKLSSYVPENIFHSIIQCCPLFSRTAHVHIFALYACVIAWISDTGSYIVGNLLGRHKLASILSPGKTWEGLFGGMFFTLIANILLLYGCFAEYIQNWWGFFGVVLYSCMIAIVATIGDLFISYCKRRAGVKDAGIILPGHGGILDRFDSVFFVAPFLLALASIAKFVF